MANYKKLIDVEVMEEVSENTMALVDENGTLKKVPCGAGFGGGKNRLIIRYTQSPAPTSLVDDATNIFYSNMTYQEFYDLLFIGEGCDAILLYNDPSSGYIFIYNCTAFFLNEENRIILELYNKNTDNMVSITFYSNNIIEQTPTIS